MSLAIPLYALLILYGIFLLVFAFYAFFNVALLLKLGTNTFHTKLILFLFVLATGFILFRTFAEAQTIDWTETMSFSLGQPTSL